MFCIKKKTENVDIPIQLICCQKVCRLKNKRILPHKIMYITFQFQAPHSNRNHTYKLYTWNPNQLLDEKCN